MDFGQDKVRLGCEVEDADPSMIVTERLFHKLMK